MSKFILIGQQVISVEHIVRAEFEEAYPGGEERYDEDSGETLVTRQRKCKLALTLTSQHMEAHIDDFSSGYYKAAASENDLVKLYGELAEATWKHLTELAIDTIRKMEAPF